MVRRIGAALLFAWFASGAFLLGWLAGMAIADVMTQWQPVTAAVGATMATGAIACAICTLAALRRIIRPTNGC